MRTEAYRRLNPTGGTPREISEVVNNVLDGKTNNSGEIELATSSATQTIIYNERIGYDSVILLMPYSAVASSQSLPYGSFISTSDQTAANTTTSYPITLGTTITSDGVSVASSSRMTVDYSGVYLLDAVIQGRNTDTQIHDIDIWLSKNGTIIDNSRKRYDIAGTHGGLDGHRVCAFTYMIQMQKDDYIELNFSVSNTTVSLQALAADTSPTRPATTSARASLIYQSANGYTTNLYTLPYISATNKGEAVISHPANTVAGKIYRYIIVA